MGAVAGHQDRVAVGTGDEQQRAAGVVVAFGIFDKRAHKGLVVLELRFDGGDAHELCIAAGHKHGLADRVADDAVLGVKAAGHAVDIGIAAEQHRLECLHKAPLLHKVIQFHYISKFDGCQCKSRKACAEGADIP